MQKIIPHLWFDTQAKEAAEFYTSVFSNSKVTNRTTLHDTPSGDCDIVSFTIRGKEFMAMSAGPLFKFNPSISFMVNFDPSKEKDAQENIDIAWEKLLEGGEVLMPIQEYPFSKRYGWLKDKYGLSWQLILTDPEGEERPEIIPSLLFVGDVCGKAQEASEFYLSVFSAREPQNTQRGAIAKYPAGMEPDTEGTIMFTDFKLGGEWLAAMDSARMHDFTFNESISFIVNCDTQEELDYYWEKLSAVPESEQCGWLKDKYGVSWQITPSGMDEMMRTTDQEALDRVTQAVLLMKKLDFATIEKAYKGE